MQAPILPSRAALAERIALQFGYGQNLIHLVGRKGLGKSFLLEHLLTEHYPDFNKAFIQATPNSDEKALMRSLLEHTFSSPLVDYALGIEENFHQIAAQNQPVAALWVIDDAWHLSEEFLAQLSRLSAVAQGTLYILIASTRAQICANAVEIHLEPLTHAESLRLLGHYFRDLPLSEDPLFAEFIRQCQGNPALLLAWPQQRELLQAQSKKSKKAWLIPVIAISAVVMATLIYLAVSSSSTQELVLPPSKQVTTLVATDKLTFASDNREDDSLAESPQELAPAQAVKRVEQSENTQQVTNDAPAIADALSAERPEQAAQTKGDAISEPPQAEAKSLYDHAWFEAQSPQQWVYQLTVLKSADQVRAFIAQSGLNNAKHYYRDDKKWHVVTWSPATDKAQLSEQKAQLAEQLPKLEPYAKPIAQIIKEIHSQPSP